MSGNQEPKSVEITETAMEQGSDVSLCFCGEYMSATRW